MTSILAKELKGSDRAVEVRLYGRPALEQRLPDWEAYLRQKTPVRPLSLDPAWLRVLSKGLKHGVYALEASQGGRIRGLLLLAYVRSLLFGRFLVSLPYLNYGGVLADDPLIGGRLLDEAVALADQLDVRYLEVRHRQPIAHQAFGESRTDKVNMRLELPETAERLWARLSAKVRNQVRKAQKNDL